jgi:hypothetical protein
MRKEQLKRLQIISDAIEAQKLDLEFLAQELLQEHDDMSEKVQEGAKGEKLQGEIDSLEEAVGDLENAVNACATARDL